MVESLIRGLAAFAHHTDNMLFFQVCLFVVFVCLFGFFWFVCLLACLLFLVFLSHFRDSMWLALGVGKGGWGWEHF